ncbi:hypothetical protein pdam_00005504, partial [Pocillopora damicornis]
YQRGRRPRGERWVLGLFGNQYVPARPHLRLVIRRNVATLLPVVQRKVNSRVDDDIASLTLMAFFNGLCRKLQNSIRCKYKWLCED